MSSRQKHFGAGLRGYATVAQWRACKPYRVDRTRHVWRREVFERGLSEFKIDYGPGYRVYAAQRGAVTVILLCGGDKRKQNADIKRARAMLAELE